MCAMCLVKLGLYYAKTAFVKNTLSLMGTTGAGDSHCLPTNKSLRRPRHSKGLCPILQSHDALWKFLSVS